MPKLSCVEFAVQDSLRIPRVKKTPLALMVGVLVLPLFACHKNIDITNAMLTNRDAACKNYSGRYTSSVMDKGENKAFKGELSIETVKDSQGNEKCVFATNHIPNHDFNDKGEEGKFKATKVSDPTGRYEITTQPEPSPNGPVELGTTYDNGIFLNGVKLDLFAAACYGIGENNLGCFDDLKGVWRFDPMHDPNKFETDTHNAHPQPPEGVYHYHGDPRALYTNCEAAKNESPVIGFAADGYPIYGPCIEDPKGQIRMVKSSYVLQPGERQRLENQYEGDTFPGGTYDGTYREDYKYTEGSGDLDRCNGMERNGQYGYYITQNFPYVMGCFRGTPDPSFKKANPGHSHPNAHSH